MKKKRFTEEQIIGALKAHEAGEKVADMTCPPKTSPVFKLGIDLNWTVRRSLMARKHYKPEEIIKILRLIEIAIQQGKSADLACKEHGISGQSYYRWRKEYGGLDITQAQRLKKLEQENTRLKKMVADLSLDKDILNEALKGNY